MAKVLLETAKKLCNTIMEDFPGIIIKKWQYDAGLCLVGFDAMYRFTGKRIYNRKIHNSFNTFFKKEGR